MNSMLVLKKKSEDAVIYYYSVDKADAPSDGEIEYALYSGEFKTLRRATGDDGGGHAVWLRQYLWRAIFKENCPDKRFIATG